MAFQWNTSLRFDNIKNKKIKNPNKEERQWQRTEYFNGLNSTLPTWSGSGYKDVLRSANINSHAVPYGNDL